LPPEFDISLVDDLFAFQFDLSFDPTVLQVVGEEGGEGITGGQVGSKVLSDILWFFPQEGTIRVMWVSDDLNPTTGSGYLVDILLRR